MSDEANEALAWDLLAEDALVEDAIEGAKTALKHALNEMVSEGVATFEAACEPVHEAVHRLFEIATRGDPELVRCIGVHEQVFEHDLGALCKAMGDTLKAIAGAKEIRDNRGVLN